MTLKFLSFLYLFIINIRNWLYDKSILPTKHLSTVVVSIGNMIVGGSGKTPFTIHLAEILINKGYSVGIICKGYKKKMKGTIVVSDGLKILCHVNDCGDEAYLIARKVHQSYVVADENKTKAAIFIEKQYNPDVILIDDGFQHRQLERDIDIVLYNTRIKNSKYKLLPVGLLREPIKNINRSNIVITTYDKKAELKLNNSIDKYFSKMKYDLNFFKNNKFISVKYPKNVIAFCGIANPQIFFTHLKENGVKIKKSLSFKDHVSYSKNLIKEIENYIKKYNLTSIVTTEKDFVKLPLDFVKKTDIYILRMNVDIDNCDKLIMKIVDKVNQFKNTDKN